MTKWFYILFLCWGIGFFCGCSRNENPGMASGSGDTQVSFVLSLSNAGTPSRATWENPYDSQEGSGYENLINPDDVQVMLFTTSGQYVAIVDILSYTSLENEAEEYRFVGSVTAEESELTSGEYKLMVFANCGTITGTSDLESLNSLFFDYNANDVKDESQLIPMWGVITPTLTLEKGKQQDLGTIDLLRAMAKIEINLADAISGTYTITEATLNKYNTQGYCLPKNYAAVKNTKELEQETGNNKDTFNPYINAQVSSNLAFSYSEDGKTAWLYIPEYDNSTSDAATISITLSDGSNNTTNGTLEFRDYANGTATGAAHNIVRNHIYHYTVNVETGKLTVQYKALPWNLVETSIGWMPQPADYAPKTSNDYPFNGGNKWTEFLAGNNYILLPTRTFEDYPTMQKLFHFLYKNPDEGDDEAKFCFICRPGYVDNVTTHDQLKEGSGGARYFFLLTGPKGATWEAHLTNTEDFSFSTTMEDEIFKYNTDGYANDGDIFKATHGIAREKPYVIQIIANYDYTSDQKFDDEYLTDWGKKKWYGQQVVDTEFYITVRLTDGTEYELTINPSYSRITEGDLDSDNKFMYKNRRRYAGTDTRIWIRQLRAQIGWSYDQLVANNEATQTGTGADDFAWWRVNPYWNSNWEPEQ